MIRDFKIEDLPAIQKIHEESGIDYTMPNLNTPLFLITKVCEEDGVVRGALGAYIQCEFYLWLDKSNWADAKKKHETLQELNKEVTEAIWLQGVDQACLYLPPGMERFGKRLEKDFGFSKCKDWAVYAKQTGRK